MERKYVTIEDARQMLPDVQKSVIRIMEINKALGMFGQVRIKYQDAYEDLHKEISANEKYFELHAKMLGEIHRLFHMGCIVKDPVLGLVDFLSTHRGREILLCWQLGESGINYWHEISGGYNGRQPISVLS